MGQDDDDSRLPLSAGLTRPCRGFHMSRTHNTLDPPSGPATTQTHQQSDPPSNTEDCWPNSNASFCCVAFCVSRFLPALESSLALLLPPTSAPSTRLQRRGRRRFAKRGRCALQLAQSLVNLGTTLPSVCRTAWLGIGVAIAPGSMALHGHLFGPS
jgi:hypothetical protein